jgi:predicted TIM-barrel fold metal-dependent hydrolase
MLGVRATFHTKPYIDWLDDGSLFWFWAMCERLHIPVMALVPGIVPKIRLVAERYPELNLLIPHMGCPLDVRGAEAFAGLNELLRLAQFPHVSVMVSSVPCFSKQSYPFRDTHPYLRRIFDTFGPRRLLWGADLSRLTSTYRECIDLFQEALGFLSGEDKDWIFEKTATTILNWPSPIISTS